MQTMQTMQNVNTKNKQFKTCHRCGGDCRPTSVGIGTGYGSDRYGNPFCYECCAEHDRERMRETGHVVLYLTRDSDGRYWVTNWPGSLRIPAGYVAKGRHNIARVRYDTWFRFEDREWHGVQYGDNTQLIHCKQTRR